MSSALPGALAMAAMKEVVVGAKRRERSETVYYWDLGEGLSKKTRVERYSTKTPTNILLQNGNYVHFAEVFDEGGQAEKFGKEAQSALAPGGGAEIAATTTEDEETQLASGNELVAC